MSQTIKNTFKSYCFFTSHWGLLTLLLEALPLLVVFSSCWGVPDVPHVGAFHRLRLAEKTRLHCCLRGSASHLPQKVGIFPPAASKRHTAGKQEQDLIWILWLLAVDLLLWWAMWSLCCNVLEMMLTTSLWLSWPCWKFRCRGALASKLCYSSYVFLVIDRGLSYQISSPLW